MNSIRARFIRGEEVKYISHLDLMKAFERALRRAHIPLAYSQGFNPHPKMVFGLPMSVGVTSEAEYADFEFFEFIEPDEFVVRLNKELPESLKVVIAKAKETGDNIMSTIAGATYDVLVSSCTNMEILGIQEKIGSFLKTPELIAVKEGKNGPKKVDIKPMLHGLALKPFKDGSFTDESGYSDKELPEILKGSCSSYLSGYITKLTNEGFLNQGNGCSALFCLSMLLSAGSVANLKPDLLVSALNSTTGIDFQTLKIHRTGLFLSKGKSFTDPLDTAVLSGK